MVEAIGSYWRRSQAAVILHLNAGSKKGGLVSIAWVLVYMRATITQNLGNRTTNVNFLL